MSGLKRQIMRLRQIPMEDIYIDWDFNCRLPISATSPETMGLARDIEEKGLQNPVIVRPIENGETITGKPTDKPFLLIAGHRRYTAMMLNKAKEIPALVQNLSIADAVLMNLSENTQREELTFEEEARGVKALMDAGYKLLQMAEALQKGRGWVQDRLDFNRLQPELQEEIRSKKIPQSMCRQLIVAKEDKELQNALVRFSKEKGKVIKVAAGKKLLAAENRKKGIIPKETPVKTIKKTYTMKSQREIQEVQDNLYQAMEGINIYGSILGWVRGHLSDADLNDILDDEMKIYDAEWKHI